MKLLIIPVLVLFAFLPAFADSVNVTDTFDVFVLEVFPNHHQMQIQLTPNGNPLIRSFAPLGDPFEVEFLVNSFSPVLSENTASFALTLAGQLVEFDEFPLDCGTPPPPTCGIGNVMNTPFFATPVNGVITVTINGLAETFNFRYTYISSTRANHAFIARQWLGCRRVAEIRTQAQSAPDREDT